MAWTQTNPIASSVYIEPVSASTLKVSTLNPVKLGFLVETPSLQQTPTTGFGPYYSPTYNGEPSIFQHVGLLTFTNPWSTVSSLNSTSPQFLTHNFTASSPKSFFSYVDFSAVIDPILNKKFAVDTLSNFNGFNYSACTTDVASLNNTHEILPNTLEFKIENGKYIVEKTTGCDREVSKTILNETFLSKFLANLNIVTSTNPIFYYDKVEYSCNSPLFTDPQDELFEKHLKFMFNPTFGYNIDNLSFCTLNFSDFNDLENSSITFTYESSPGVNPEINFDWITFKSQLEFVNDGAAFDFFGCRFEYPIAIE